MITIASVAYSFIFLTVIDFLLILYRNQKYKLPHRAKFDKFHDLWQISWENVILNFAHKYNSRFLCSIWNVRTLAFVNDKETDGKKTNLTNDLHNF